MTGSSPAGTAAPLRVLVVDDDRDVAEVHRGYVERLDGFVVCAVAHTGADAVREVDTVRAALAGGVLSYLVKPFTLAALGERMQAYAGHREELRRRSVATGGGLEQRDIDRLLHLRAAGAPSALPKGLSERTLELVAGCLRAGAHLEDDLSAGEVALRCGLSRVSARRYLEHLERSDLAVVRPRYGSAGRPENGYRWVA